MIDLYAQWIDKNVPSYEYAYGKCLSVTKAMQEAFPELTVVYGTYHCPIWGERWHQWLVTPEGEIIDPTVKQFPSQQGIYTPKQPHELPVGTCANCGELYYDYYDGTVCSQQCGDAFIRSLLR